MLDEMNLILPEHPEHALVYQSSSVLQHPIMTSWTCSRCRTLIRSDNMPGWTFPKLVLVRDLRGGFCAGPLSVLEKFDHMYDHGWYNTFVPRATVQPHVESASLKRRETTTVSLHIHQWVCLNIDCRTGNLDS